MGNRKKKAVLGAILMGGIIVVPRIVSAAKAYVGPGTLDGKKTEANEFLDPTSVVKLGKDGSDVEFTTFKGRNWAIYGDDAGAKSNDVHVDLVVTGRNIKSDAVMAYDGANVTVGSDTTEKMTIETSVNKDAVRSITSNPSKYKAPHLTLKAKEISITSNKEACGALYVQHTTQYETVPEDVASIALVADTIKLTAAGAADTAIYGFANGKIDITGDTMITAPTAIDVRENSIVNINVDGAHTTVIHGDIQFETLDKATEGKVDKSLVNSYINLNLSGSKSSWTGCAYQKDGQGVENLAAPDSGNPFYGPISGFSLSLSKGAHWNVTGDSFVNRVHSTDGIINLGDGAKKIIVDNVYGTSLTVNTESLDHTMTIKKKSDETDLTVHGTGGMADDIQKDHTVAQKLADITRNEKGISVANHVTTAEGVLAGSYKLEVVDGKVQMPQPPKEKDASDKEDINPKGDTDASKPDDAVKPKDGTDSGKTDEQPPKDTGSGDKADADPKADTDAPKPDDSVKPKDGTDSGKTDEQPPKDTGSGDKADANPKADTDASKPDDAVKPKDGTDKTDPGKTDEQPPKDTGSGDKADTDPKTDKDAHKTDDTKHEDGTSGTDSGKTDESGADSSKHNATDGKVKLTYTPNKTNVAIASLAAMNLMTWRQENNDMYKRLGELRDSKGQQGLWVRMVRGQIKYGVRSMKNQYSYYQVGWDTKVGSNWTVGAAYSKTDGTTSFYRGTADNDHDGAAIYGSYLADDGSFIDLIAKYTHIDTDYETFHGAGSASYDNDAFSVSAEYGKRFHGKGGLWIEPQAELTYGRVSAADFLTKNGVKVYSDSAGSLVGRLGMVLGRDIKAGHLYAKASYLYDFDGDTITNMTYKGAKERFSDDIGGGWWEVGIGANLNLNKATYLYIDAEKTCGGNVAAPWQWSLGVRYSF
ncbi:autotransporter outer membrane beta-barrel domain-containing protein [Acidaminococcus intestini]|uniref:autotransporter outer membrane beta-barrel domain-containing protein n=1 Tax=Acidaminococcus intestini TaxID=187327 RepID=UPI001EDE946D|nr:autotransporter outer membrane beta-barrel domain-containing protein [Acidaminococcus intestini]MCG4852106.1 autotransporter outer membrane beta-barrel domain-containing protein [Acidaminococcus intestini]